MHDHQATHLRGMLLCLAALLLFACQDAFTKVLARDYAVAQFLLVRFWAFAAFATVFAALRCGVGTAARSARPLLQLARCTIVVIEIGMFAYTLRYLGLAEVHAISATFPLIATLLAGPVLGEAVGWRRRVAVAVGFAGALIIIRPGAGVFHVAALVALAASVMFAVYNVLTRLVSRSDRFETSLLYLAWVGAIGTTPFGLAEWRSPDAHAWLLMVLLAVCGIIGHLLFIKALELTPASLLQPLNYSMLVWATLIGFAVFGELPDMWTVIGALVVVGSGLYAMFRERVRKGAEAVPTSMLASSGLSEDMVHSHRDDARRDE